MFQLFIAAFINGCEMLEKADYHAFYGSIGAMEFLGVVLLLISVSMRGARQYAHYRESCMSPIIGQEQVETYNVYDDVDELKED